MPSGRVFYSPGDSDTPAAGTGDRAGRLLPAPPGRRPVRRHHPRRLRRARPAAGHGDRSGRQRHDRRQRLPRAAARHGHRPQRQPGVGRLRRPRPGHRHRGDGQDHRGARRPADRLRRRSRRRDPAGPVRRPAGRPGRHPGQRHHPVPLRPRRLPADQHARRSPRRRPSTPWPARPTSPTWPRRPLPRRPADHEVPVPLRLLRRLRPGDPAQGAGGARPGHRRRPGGVTALGRVRLDDLRQQGPAGPAVRAVLLGHQRLRVRRADRGQHGPVLRPAGPRRGHAAPRQQLGRRRSSARGRSSSGTATTPCWWPTRAPTPTSATTSSGCSAPAPFTSWYELRIGGTYGATAQDQAAAAGRGAEGRRPRRHARGQPPRLGRPGLPGGRGQRRRGPVSDPDRATTPRASRSPLSTRWAGGRRSTCYRGPQPGGGFSTWPAATWPASPSTRSTRTAARGAA